MYPTRTYIENHNDPYNTLLFRVMLGLNYNPRRETALAQRLGRRAMQNQFQTYPSTMLQNPPPPNFNRLQNQRPPNFNRLRAQYWQTVLR